MPIYTIAQLMLSILFMMGLGFALAKRGIIDEAFSSKLSFLLLQVVIPCHMLAVGNTRYSPALAGKMVWAGGIVAAYYLCAFVGMYALSRALPLPREDKNAFVNLTVLANVGYIGFPIIQQLYGAEGGLYAIVYNLGFILVAYTAGLALMGGRPTIKHFFTTPGTLCPVLSILLFISPVRLPALAVYPLEQISVLSAPFSMFIVGAAMARVRFSTLLTSGWVWLVSLLRQFALPGLVAFALFAAGFSGVLPAALVVTSALPSGALNVIFAGQYGRGVVFSTRAVVQGTLLMVAALPVVIWVCGWLF